MNRVLSAIADRFPQDTTRLTALVLVACVVLSFWMFARAISADLLATWLAGQYFAAGDLARVYPGDSSVFTMYPPDGWRDFMADQGYQGPIFPFIYPPLWAWVGSMFPGYTAFRVISLIMTLVNPCLLAATVLLARRAADVKLDPLLYVAIAIIFVAGSSVGLVALAQNQPQIVVSFLIVLAIERSRAGSDRMAGGALALAAAIKLYPVLFVLFWLACRRYRPVAWFAIFGALLFGLSVAVAGWPLHAELLRQLSVIANTALVTGASFNLDPAIAQLFFADQLAFFPAPETASAVEGWYALEKGALWSTLSKLLMLGSVAAVCVWMHWADDHTRYAALWPLGLTLVSLLGPLSWSYHFIPAVVFLPALLDRFEPRYAASCLLAILLPVFAPLATGLRTIGGVPFADQLAGTVAMLLMAMIFVLAALRNHSTANAP